MSLIQLTVLEDIFLKSFGVDQNTKGILMNLIDNVSLIYDSNILSYQELFNYFVTSQIENLKIWIIQKLAQLVEKDYKQYPDEDKLLFRNAIFYIIDNKINELMSNPLLKQKFSYLIIIWLKYDFPDSSNTFFNDFLGRVYKLKDGLMINLLGKIFIIHLIIIKI